MRQPSSLGLGGTSGRTEGAATFAWTATVVYHRVMQRAGYSLPVPSPAELERQARDRHSALVEKKYASSLTAEEREELLRLEQRLDQAEAEFYEPIEGKL